MSRKKKHKKSESKKHVTLITEYILLATATFELIEALIETIKSLFE